MHWSPQLGVFSRSHSGKICIFLFKVLAARLTSKNHVFNEKRTLWSAVDYIRGCGCGLCLWSWLWLVSCGRGCGLLGCLKLQLLLWRVDFGLRLSLVPNGCGCDCGWLVVLAADMVVFVSFRLQFCLWL